MRIWESQQTFDDSQNNFTRCCNSPNLNQYECVHNPQPISLSGSNLHAIEMLLWYIPNIDSVQSEKVDLITEEVFDEFTYKFFLESMNLSESDICWYRRDKGKNPKVTQEVPQELWNFYHDELCDKCQKLMIVVQKNQSRVQNILRCVRNCIAHGDFYIVGDTIIGFNSYIENGCTIKTAIVKFKPSILLQTLQRMQQIYIRERLFAFAFERVGYTIEVGSRTRINNTWFMFDFEMRKDDHLYAVEIKTGKRSQYFEDEEIDHMISRFGEALIGRDITLVIVVDNSKLKTAQKEKLQNQGFTIIDKASVKDLLNGIDVLNPSNS